MKHLLIILLFVIVLTNDGKAQDGNAKVTAEIIASSSTKVVKGSPFSAEATTESVQVLPDDNRITRSSKMKLYRDGEGRFRREGDAGSGGIVSAYGFQATISINDPVEAIRYILFPDSKTARSYNTQNKLSEKVYSVSGQAQSKAQIEKTIAEKANIVISPNAVTGTFAGGGKTEQLGTKNIEGVECEGSRTVTTIAAGSIGNEKPIEIIYERWYSKELDLIVYSRHYDPRYGEQIYRLTNIRRGEPDRSLFSVPSDYKIIAEPPLKIYTTKPE
jgi:hypothetical protein